MATDFFSAISALLSFLACIWLFSAYSHIHPQKRSIPLQMILVLGIFDIIQALAILIYHGFGLFSQDDKQQTNDLCYFTQTIFWFSAFASLFWSCVIAAFSAKGINVPQEISPEHNKKLYCGILICLGLTALLGAPLAVQFSNTVEVPECSFMFSKNKVELICFQILIPCFAILITLFSYFKVGVAMKNVPSQVLSLWMINPSFLMWYPISQLVLYVPYLFTAIWSFVGTPAVAFGFIWKTMIHLSGFVNSVVYLKMRRDIRRQKKNERSLAGSFAAEDNEEGLVSDGHRTSLMSGRKSNVHTL